MFRRIYFRQWHLWPRYEIVMSPLRDRNVYVVDEVESEGVRRLIQSFEVEILDSVKVCEVESFPMLVCRAWRSSRNSELTNSALLPLWF